MSQDNAINCFLQSQSNQAVTCTIRFWDESSGSVEISISRFQSTRTHIYRLDFFSDLDSSYSERPHLSTAAPARLSRNVYRAATDVRPLSGIQPVAVSQLHANETILLLLLANLVATTLRSCVLCPSINAVHRSPFNARTRWLASKEIYHATSPLRKLTILDLERIIREETRLTYFS